MNDFSTSNIGGFHELELPDKCTPYLSAWDHMTSQTVAPLTYTNARSALHTILESNRPSTIWYPAYYCCEAIVNLPDSSIDFFPVGQELEPDIDWLNKKIKSGDALIGVDYFGRSPSENFCEFVKHHPDILWIEDRAQAISPKKTWGDWVIYSSRKLFGVPDGGIAICMNSEKYNPERISQPKMSNDRFIECIAPLLLRLEDREGTENYSWYSKFRNSEELNGITKERMSNTSKLLLRMIDIKQHIERRLSNAIYLHTKLPNNMQLFSATPTEPLIGYPIVVDNRDYIASELAKNSIFCPVHWRNQASPACFSDEHKLSQSILTLPSDQRYSENDMDKISSAISSIIS